MFNDYANIIMNFKFTIFTPCYNGAHCIHRVFDSLDTQTYDNYEWYIVNDASTDNSLAVIDELLQKFRTKHSNEVHVINHLTNRGKHRSWNEVAQLASSDLFLCCDCDDSFMPNTLETLNSEWNKTYQNKYVAGIYTLCVNNKGQIVGDSFPEDRLVSDFLELDYVYHVKGEKWNLIRTNIIKEIPFPEINFQYYSESYIWYNIALRDLKVICLNTPLRVYYYEPLSLTNNRKIHNPKRMAMFRHFDYWKLTNLFKYYLQHSPTKIINILKHIILTYCYQILCFFKI